MTEEELSAIKEMHPTALDIWFDHMHEMPMGQVLETLLFHMPAGVLLTSIYNIEADMKESRDNDGPTEATE